jgi:hypothetical protein
MVFSTDMDTFGRAVVRLLASPGTPKPLSLTSYIVILQTSQNRSNFREKLPGSRLMLIDWTLVQIAEPARSLRLFTRLDSTRFDSAGCK